MKFLTVFAFWFSFMTLFAVEDEGGGAGAGDDGAGTGDDGSNNEGGDNGNGGNDGGVGDESIGDEADNEETALTPDEIKEFRYMHSQLQEKETISAVEKSIQSRIPGFSAEKTLAGIRELAKTDPQKAKYYNASEAGWEMFYKDNLSNIAQGDDINSGSHSGGSGDFDSTLEKARGGDKKSIKNALAQSKA